MTSNPTILNWNEALDHYNLNYEVSKRPVRAMLGEGREQVIDNLYSIVRSDTNSPLPGVAVNGRYECIQTSEFADIGNTICGQVGAEFVGGGSLMGGKGLFLQAKLPDCIRVRGTDDKIDKMLTFITAHDGSLPFMVAFLAERLFCKNQFKAIGDELRASTKIRHTRSSDTRLKEAHHVVLESVNAYRRMEVKLNWLTQQSVTDAQMALATRRLFGVKDATETQDIPTRTANNINAVLQTVATGPGQHMFRGSAYNLWNGMTHWADHVRAVRKVNDTSAGRFEAGLVGSGSRLKDKAINVVDAIVAQGNTVATSVHPS